MIGWRVPWKWDVAWRFGELSQWSVYVIHVLGDARTLRFNDLRSQVDGISQRMLRVTLRGLQRDGMPRGPSTMRAMEDRRNRPRRVDATPNLRPGT